MPLPLPPRRDLFWPTPLLLLLGRAGAWPLLLPMPLQLLLPAACKTASNGEFYGMLAG
jgi:hypothetical protein